jgi:hypothetical protein
MADQNSPAPAARPRAKHLMDPANPRPRKQDPMSLGQVQKWVLSSLAAATILHMSGGLVLAAMFLDESRMDGRIGLLLIAGIFGVIAVLAARAIHQRPLLTPWLLLGTLPAQIGVYLTFWR